MTSNEQMKMMARCNTLIDQLTRQIESIKATMEMIKKEIPSDAGVRHLEYLTTK